MDDQLTAEESAQVVWNGRIEAPLSPVLFSLDLCVVVAAEHFATGVPRLSLLQSYTWAVDLVEP